MFKKIAMIASLMLSTFTGVQAEPNWPTKPVKVTVGFAPGGGTDITARVWAKYMSEIWGQPVVIENRPGAGGNLGVRHMLAEPADGYILSSVQTGNFGPQHVLTKPSYNWMTDLISVAYNGVGQPFVLVVSSQSKITNLKEFQKWAQSKQLSYGFPGIGVAHHLYGALLSEHFKLPMTPVPYKSAPQIVNDVMAGQLDFIVAPSAAIIEQNVKAGKLNVVAVFSDRQSPLFPGVQTAGQQGIPGSWPQQWFEIAVPAATPAHIVNKIRTDSRTAWSRTYAELIERGAIDPNYKDWPDSFEKAHQAQQDGWNNIVQRAKIKPIE